MTLVLGFFAVISTVTGIFSIYNAVVFSRKARYYINNNKKEIKKEKVSST